VALVASPTSVYSTRTRQTTHIDTSSPAPNETGASQEQNYDGSAQRPEDGTHKVNLYAGEGRRLLSAPTAEELTFDVAVLVKALGTMSSRYAFATLQDDDVENSWRLDVPRPNRVTNRVGLSPSLDPILDTNPVLLTLTGARSRGQTTHRS
jgi:hypothetical protein